MNYKLILNNSGKSNYHTHTFYCDGKNSPEEMVKGAISRGFHSLGFSGHQYSPQDADYAMSLDAEKNYRDDITGLKEKYKNEINIYLGIERDYCSEATDGFHYVIGSCHHVKVDGGWMDVDWSAEIMEEGVKNYFEGDYMSYVKAYYDIEGNVLSKTKGQIVGHFDLVAKFNKGNKYFDEFSKEYLDIAKRAADRIIEEYVDSRRWEDTPVGFPEELLPGIETRMPIFEINSGAMVKGLRSFPYPSKPIMEYLMERGVPLILSSDCHNAEYLDYGFDVEKIPVK